MFEVANCDLKVSRASWRSGRKLEAVCVAVGSDLLQALYIVDTGYLSDSVDDSLEVFQVGNFEDYIHIGLAVFAAR